MSPDDTMVVSVLEKSSGVLISFHCRKRNASFTLLKVRTFDSMRCWLIMSLSGSSGIWLMFILSRCLIELSLLVMVIGGMPSIISPRQRLTLNTAPIADLIILYQSGSNSLILRGLIQMVPA